MPDGSADRHCCVVPRARRQIISTIRKEPAPSSSVAPSGLSNRGYVELYERLRRIAREYEGGHADGDRCLVAEAAKELLGTDLAARVWAGPPDLDGLDEAPGFCVAYLCGLLDGSVGTCVDDDFNTRFDGCSRKIATIRAKLSKYARSWRSVLIVGERGSGKGQFMRAVAAARDSTVLTVNLAAVSENLADSELFGHVRGAFTDATTTRAGLIQTASDARGALYLDDVAECPESVQARLLTCLDDGVFRPVGSDKIVSIGRGRDRQFRVFASSQPGALHKVRPDLRDRLAGLLVEIPPIRDSKLDVLLLADVALQVQSGRKTATRRTRFSSGARRVLLSYSWPGNIRQLFNVVGRVLMATEGTATIGATAVAAALDVEQRLATLSACAGGDDLVSASAESFPTLAESEARLVQAALARTGGNVTRAAALLGVNRTTLHRRISRAQRQRNRSTENCE